MNKDTLIAAGLLSASLLTVTACGAEGATANSSAAAAENANAVTLADKPTFDTHAGETNLARRLADRVHCVGATATAHGDVVEVSIELDPPDAKGVQMKVTLGGNNSATGYVSGTSAKIRTDAGRGYGRFNATAFIPIGGKGTFFDQTECPSVGIDQQ